jgi:putative ubiquitin-RnfH superfamily antitoxin RatB of RatAB toxin-antitoxin module
VNRGPQHGIRVRIVYALADKVWEKELPLPRGTTATEAVIASGIFNEIPGLAGTTLKLGVFGELAGEHYMLEDGDRLEIYRPLISDPKEARRRLAREGKVMGSRGGEAQG